MIDWQAWRNEPALVAALVGLGWLYSLAAGPFRERLAPGEPFPKARALRFAAGLVLLYLAFGSPIEPLGRYFYFSVNVGQDLLVAYPAAGLVVWGLPPWMADAALGPKALRALVGFFTRPPVAGALFLLALSVWDLPQPFEWALWVDGARAFREATILAVSILFWWPLLGPSRLLKSPAPGMRLVYLFGIEVALTGVFSYLLMADHAIFPAYDAAPRPAGALDPLNDQRLAGILLAGVSSFVLVGAFGMTFRHWALQSERAST